MILSPATPSRRLANKGLVEGSGLCRRAVALKLKSSKLRTSHGDPPRFASSRVLRRMLPGSSSMTRNSKRIRGPVQAKHAQTLSSAQANLIMPRKKRDSYYFLPSIIQFIITVKSTGEYQSQIPCLQLTHWPRFVWLLLAIATPILSFLEAAFLCRPQGKIQHRS
jgi:hypothetical protein